MLNLVRIALTRPYTFVVLALLILIVGPLAALRTPIDIFPEIRIPVIAVVWQYTGLPPDQMSGRITTPFERALTTTVNDIEHIESQSLRASRSSRCISSRTPSRNSPITGQIIVAAAVFNDFIVPADFSYDVDMWERVRRSNEAQRSIAAATQDDEAGVELAVQTDVAQA